jgi:hypothetical protein
MADLYIGVTLWEIVTQGGTPYEGLNNKVSACMMMCGDAQAWTLMCCLE